MCQGVLPFTLVFLSSFALLFINGQLVTSKMVAPSFASGVSPIVIPTYHPVIPTEETPPDPNVPECDRVGSSILGDYRHSQRATADEDVVIFLLTHGIAFEVFSPILESTCYSRWTLPSLFDT